MGKRGFIQYCTSFGLKQASKPHLITMLLFEGFVLLGWQGSTSTLRSPTRFPVPYWLDSWLHVGESRKCVVKTVNGF